MHVGDGRRVARLGLPDVDGQRGLNCLTIKPHRPIAKSPAHGIRAFAQANSRVREGSA
jgi:hypothetical protein